MKYHITDDGPRTCAAVVGTCPYGQKGGQHFDNQADAQVHYESTMASKYGQLGSDIAKQRNNSPLQKFYRASDRISQNHPAIKALQARRAVRTQAPTRRNINRQTRRSTKTKLMKKRRSYLSRKSSAFMKKQRGKVKRALTPNSRKIKQMMLVKYWMPDIKSNKWR